MGSGSGAVVWREIASSPPSGFGRPTGSVGGTAPGSQRPSPATGFGAARPSSTHSGGSLAPLPSVSCFRTANGPSLAAGRQTTRRAPSGSPALLRSNGPASFFFPSVPPNPYRTSRRRSARILFLTRQRLMATPTRLTKSTANLWTGVRTVRTLLGIQRWSSKLFGPFWTSEIPQTHRTRGGLREFGRPPRRTPTTRTHPKPLSVSTREPFAFMPM